MTKEKARKRAKAKSAQKIRKREENAENPGQQNRHGMFDPGALSIKGPNASGNASNFATAKRGSARSK